MKLNVKIPLIIGAVVLIASAGIGLVTLYLSSNELEKAILDAIGDTTTANAEFLSVTLSGQLDVVWEIANRARTRTMDRAVIQPSLMPDIPRLGFDSMALIYPNGISYDIEKSTIIDLSDRDYFKRAMQGEKSIVVIFSRLTNSIMVFFIAPIFQSDRQGAPVIGVLLASKDGATAISNIVVNLKNSMPSGYSYLMEGSDGTFIAHPNTELVTSQFNPITESKNDPSLKSLAEVTRRALTQKNGIARYDFEGRHMIGRYAEVPGYPWLLFSAIEKSDIDKRLAKMRVVLLLTALGVSIALTAALTFVGSRSVMVTVEERDKITREAIERQAEIERLMNVLKQSSESRTAFLVNISGAMADPINNIIRLSSLLAQYSGAAEDYQKDVEAINDEGMKLYDIISDVLDILKIEAGKLKLNPVKYKLPQFISDITSRYAILAEGRPIKYKLVVDDKLPENLAGDELRIKQICYHLLDNAFKYTREGSITVSITSKVKNGIAVLYIKVADTGIGIPDDKMHNVFENYGQGSGGIGLFICKQLVELMKGKLSAASEQGKGSAFTLCVPQKLLSNETIGAGTAQKLAAFKF